MRDGAGTYNLPPGNPVVTETVISSTTHNTTMADVATALTQSVSKDGQTTYTGNQSMGGFRHTQVSDATARNQYATAAQVQDGNLTLISAVSGTDTITGSISPAISAYANGVFLTLIPVNNNTGAVTLSLNGLAARPVVKFNSVPLVAGDLLTGVPATLVYNGTSFYLENPQVVATDVARLSQANNFTSNNTFSVAGSASAPTVRLSSSQPLLEMNNTSAPVDNRSWLNYVTTGGSWVLASDNDAHSLATNIIVASKTSLALAATNITFNGVNVSDYARLSSGGTFRQPVAVQGSDGNGYVALVSGGATQPGYVGFYTSDAVRRGYVGYTDGSNFLMLASETGWSWKFSATPYVGAVPINDAAIMQSGTFANARVAQSNVTQHQAALAINASQVTAVPGTIGGSAAVTTAQTGHVNVVDSASTVTLTVTTNCLGGDGKAALYIRRNTGAVTFSASGVTIRSPGGGLSISVQHGKAALIQVTNTEFELAGNV